MKITNLESDFSLIEKHVSSRTETLIIFGLPQCEVCGSIKEAFSTIESDLIPDDVYYVILDPAITSTRMLVEHFVLPTFPALVWFRNGEKFKSWEGFFTDSEPAVRAEKLLNTLEAAAKLTT